MTSPILSRRKWMLHAHNQHIVVVKGTRERFVHPLMKALIWALYLPQYPSATIEVRIGDKYKPDVVALGEQTPYQIREPLFWGEAGKVGRDKIESLVRRYPDTHFVIGKWNTRLKPHIEIIKAALENNRRSAPFDVINFPAHSDEFIDASGGVNISFDDVERVRLT